MTAAKHRRCTHPPGQRAPPTHRCGPGQEHLDGDLAAPAAPANGFWVVFVLLLAYLGVRVSLIVPGGTMQERSGARMPQAQLTGEEFEAQKARGLGGG